MVIRMHDDGSLRLDPLIWLREKGTLGNFRKLLKLSAKSDRWYGTDTLSEWEQAVRERAAQTESAELYGAECDHKSRLTACRAWLDQKLHREDERFRKQNIHRKGMKSHAERVEEIREKYREMLEREEKRYAGEVTQIRNRAAKLRELSAAQLEEIGKLREEVKTA